jgi:hypothetical protein
MFSTKFRPKLIAQGLLLTFTALNLLNLTSCSTVDKMAISSVGGIVQKGAPELETETNWQFFSLSLPANLKLSETLLYIHPNEKDLLATLTKGFAAYGLVVTETLALEENYAKEAGPISYVQQTKHYYSKAIQYGLRYLNAAGLNFADLQKDAANIPSTLDKHFNSKSQRDQETIFFLAQSMAGLVNIDKSDSAQVGNLELIHKLFDWVCVANPKIYFGACPIFYGAYEAGRPKTLGGNPELAKTHFETAIKENPNNLFADISYIQYLLLPTFDEEGYAAAVKVLEAKAEKLQKSSFWSPIAGTSDKSTDASATAPNKRLNIFNMIAIERLKTLKKHEKSFF